MRRIVTQFLTSLTLLLTLFASRHISAQSTVVIPGNFESELGCSGDWLPDCNATRLIQTAPNTWEGTFLIPAGNWEYKVAYDNSWAENYGLYGIRGGDNIPLLMAVASYVHFTYSTITHLVAIDFATPPNIPSAVVLAGNFQNEVGCSGDWQPDCKATALSYDVDSKLWYGIFVIPPGNWEYKVTIDNSWIENYGQGGVRDGPNIPLTVSGDKKILFRYNHDTHLVNVSVIDYSVILAGSFQSELGCPNDWQPDCPLTGLTFDAPNDLWKQTLALPPGNWEFKVVLNGSWNENYGEGGVPGGPNIKLNLTVPTTAFFIYNPVTHVVMYSLKPETVVLPGNFQNELGCSGDWMPDCDNTRLTYDVVSKTWSGTYDIPAGDWEYKVALYNSWDENYGLYGLKNGSNIPLHLELPANITFVYDPVSHLVTLIYNATGLCATAFYDANANGYKDYDENTPMEGVGFILSGKSSATQYSGSDGKTCFTNLTQGVYTVESIAPAGYLSSVLDSQSVYLTQPQILNFGIVCLGGAGARDLGFWMNKSGKAAFDSLWDWQTGYILSTLRYFSLRNTDGSDFDPYTFEELSAWMQKANARNVAYKLSAHLAALYLNSEIRMLGNRAIYTPGINYWGLQRDFMNLYTVVWYVNQQLLLNPTSAGGDANRAELEYLTSLLEQANSDLTFVQLNPCGSSVTSAKKKELNEISGFTSSRVIWPNPSNGNFNLQPPYTANNANVQIRVMDINGKLIYRTIGSPNRIYQFGKDFIPGLYFVELSQNGNRSTIKIVKQ